MNPDNKSAKIPKNLILESSEKKIKKTKGFGENFPETCRIILNGGIPSEKLPDSLGIPGKCSGRVQVEVHGKIPESILKKKEKEKIPKSNY